MTQLQKRTISCPKCDESFSVVYYASITSWMDPALTQDFLDGKRYHFACPSCGQNIRLVTKVIINAPKGMFTISTDTSREEKIARYKEFGLLDEKDNVKDTQQEWLLHQLTKNKSPADTVTQMRRHSKLLEDISDKIKLYKIFIKEKTIIDESEEEEFKKLRDRWEKERELEGTYLHQPTSAHSNISSSVLFYKLWKDLLELKSRLDELK
ncbi:MAG: hypothetical protein JW776_06140 [Candidatus Lokiarchaeota archaeon]|nr:hypothetical protein [Candidatus Lokiarchaeota archaeon]